MGSGVSTSTDYTTEEKETIAKSLKSKYSVLKESNTEQSDDIMLFHALQEEFKNINSEIIEKRKASTPTETESNISVEDTKTSMKFANTSEKGSEKYDYFPTKGINKSISDDTDINRSMSIGASGKVDVGKLIRAQTSSQLLSAVNESTLDDQTKIENFISQLKAGEIKTNASGFRARRLTYAQKTSEEPEPVVEVKKPTARTTIFSSSEIGVKQLRKAPFPTNIMGTYSCHGIEPSYDEESGIHDKINQDRGCVVYPYNSSNDEALLLVLDGHGEQGDRVSEFVMRQIVVSLEKDPLLLEDPVKALKNTFIMTNTALMVTPINYVTSGTTCVGVYMKGTKLYVANVGDSRAVMAQKSSDGSLIAKDLSRDHKPDDPEEMSRILSWGGYVLPPPEPGLSARVYLNPECTMIGLAMSRSIGDHAVKAVGVIPEPEVTIFDLEPQDEFLVMASDGVWEFITSQEAIDIVSSKIDKGVDTACQELIEVATQRWQEEEGDYRDDITAVILRVPLPFQKK